MEDLISWPESLPLPLLKSYSTKPKSGLLQTKMASGYTRIRRQFKSQPTAMQASFLFTCDEYALFEGLLEHELNGGADYFIMPVKLPKGVIASEVRIVPDSIGDKPISQHLWSVKLKIEIRKREVISADTTYILRTEGANVLHDAVETLRQVFK